MADNTSKRIRNSVIYQVFTRNYRGGTFKDVQADLPRIRALGADILYLLPVQPSGEVHRKGGMGSPYAIRDYRAIDPVQGTMEDFIALSEAVHAAGMKLMIDVVYNHTSPDSVLAKTHPEWFFHKPDGSLGNRVGDWWDVVDLDYANAELWDYQIETLKLWAQYVDGFRCDVAPLVPLAFWERARREVETVRPGCLWLAESVEQRFIDHFRREGLTVLSDGELYRAFDICYDHDVYYDLKAVLQGTEPLSEYLRAVNAQETTYPDNYSRLRFLENHDRPRAAAMVPDLKALRNWTAWCMFAKGTAMVYAGQEYLDPHHPTLFDRDPARLEGEAPLSDLMRRMADIKRDPLFADGYFRARNVGSVIIAEFELGKRRALGFFCTDGLPHCVDTDLENGVHTDAVSGGIVDLFEGALTLTGEPVVILTEK